MYDDGTFTPIDFPGATSTSPIGINDNGQIVGWYTTGTRSGNFLYSGGVYTALAIPGLVYGINDAGQIVGIYGTLQGTTQGFLLTGDSYTTISYPGAYQTFAYGLNDNGQVVGQYQSSFNGDDYGFLYSAGSYITIDPGTETQPTGINDLGQITGGAGHLGFIATPVPAPEPSSFSLVSLCSGLLASLFLRNRPV